MHSTLFPFFISYIFLLSLVYSQDLPCVCPFLVCAFALLFSSMECMCVSFPPFLHSSSSISSISRLSPIPFLSCYSSSLVYFHHSCTPFLSLKIVNRNYIILTIPPLPMYYSSSLSPPFIQLHLSLHPLYVPGDLLKKTVISFSPERSKAFM